MVFEMIGEVLDVDVVFIIIKILVFFRGVIWCKLLIVCYIFFVYEWGRSIELISWKWNYFISVNLDLKEYENCIYLWFR